MTALAVMLTQLGCEEEPPKPDPIEPTPTEKQYTIGEYYKDGDVEGVVFYLDDWDLRTSGKIVSLHEVKNVAWSINPAGNLSTSETDGVANMNNIKKIINWQNDYPAFYACDTIKGGDWYLPVASEMISILRMRKLNLNDTLDHYGGKIIDPEANHVYWTSVSGETVGNAVGAILKGLIPGDSIFPATKNSNTFVRAVRKF